MNSNFSSFGDEVGEVLHEAGNIVKKQVTAKPNDQTQGMGDQGQDKMLETGGKKQGQKIDPVTGKPMPSKKMLTNLNQQVAQLAQMRLKKVREELEKQRLKVGESVKGKGENAGPEVKQEEPKPKEDIVAKTLKGSKSTGEFKGLIGG